MLLFLLLLLPPPLPSPFLVYVSGIRGRKHLSVVSYVLFIVVKKNSGGFYILYIPSNFVACLLWLPYNFWRFKCNLTDWLHAGWSTTRKASRVWVWLITCNSISIFCVFFFEISWILVFYCSLLIEATCYVNSWCSFPCLPRVLWVLSLSNTTILISHPWCVS